MIEPKDLPTGYYRVRKGTHPSGAPHWRVAQWKPTSAFKIREEWLPGWLMGDEKFSAGHWDEIGAKVA